MPVFAVQSTSRIKMEVGNEQALDMPFGSLVPVAK